jgi:hypothetical protein
MSRKKQQKVVHGGVLPLDKSLLMGDPNSAGIAAALLTKRLSGNKGFEKQNFVSCPGQD